MDAGSWRLRSSLLLAAAAAMLAGATLDGARPKSAPPMPAVALVASPTWADRLRDGDLLFRTGRDMTSRIVLAQSSDSRYSHVGMVIVQDGRPLVLHAVPTGGVVLQTLAYFAAPERAAEVAALRPTALGDLGRVALRAYALAQVGKPFDDELAYSEDSRLFCTELVMKALAKAGIDADTPVPRVRVPLHDEAIPTPDDLSRWTGLVRIDTLARENAR
jgi:permuted papain-like amidase YaeF/Yiix C92 family enzyme